MNEVEVKKLKNILKYIFVGFSFYPVIYDLNVTNGLIRKYFVSPFCIQIRKDIIDVLSLAVRKKQ